MGRENILALAREVADAKRRNRPRGAARFWRKFHLEFLRPRASSVHILNMLRFKTLFTTRGNRTVLYSTGTVRGAVDSGLAAVLAAVVPVESVAVFVRVCVFGFGWMVVTCEVRPCDPFARVRPCVPCVPCVSRLPPVSFYRCVCPGSPRCPVK